MFYIKFRYTLGLAVFVFLFLAIPSFNIKAAIPKEKEIIDIAVVENSPRYIDNILYEAFSRLGYKLNITSRDITSAAVASNSGRFDGLGVYAEALGQYYPNLIKIPEAIAHVEFKIFAKHETSFDIKNWNDFTGLRVAFEHQHDYIESKIKNAAKDIVYGYGVSELFGLLSDDKCDVVIIQKALHQEMLVPDGIRHLISLDKLPVYPYIHKSREHMLTDLTNILREMNNDGTINKYHSQERNPLSNNNGKKNILYISSNSEDTAWNKELFSEIESSLSGLDDNEINAFSLNSNKYVNNSANTKAIADMIRSHYAASNPDAIIVSDYAALEFIKEHYFSFFKGIPVVFCGINNYSPDMIKGYEKYFTGVTEYLSAAETTEQLLKMFPNTKNIFVINDFSKDGRAWQKDIKAQLQSLENSYNIIYNPNCTMSELIDIIRSLPEDTLILSGMFYIDSNGAYFSEKLFEKSICQNTDNPVCSLISSRVGYGELGGKCVSGVYQGITAANMALKLAEGTDISSMPVAVDVENENTWIFDYRVLEKYDLKKYSLPQNTVLINKPYSFRESNPTAYYLVISASFLIIILIVVLLVYQRMLANKNKSLILSQANLHSAEELLEKEILLRQSKELLERVIQTAPLAYIFSVSGVVINSNIYAQELLDIFPGDDIKNIYYDKTERKYILDKLESNNFISSEIVRFKTKDFNVNRYHVNISQTDYEGNTAYIIWGINIESGELQRDMLEKAHKDMKKLLDALPIPLLIINPANMHPVYVNASYMVLFGLKPSEDFEKIDVFRFLPEKQLNGEDSINTLTSLMQTAAQSAVPVEAEIRHVRDNGEPVDVKMICETLSYRGISAIIVLMQDISAEKRQAEMLKNTADKEKEANQLKDRFIINMSHEIRTPMNAILGLSEIEMQKKHTRETNDTFRKINTSAKNLLTIVNDILDFSKIEAEKIDITEDIFDLEEVIANAVTVASQRLDGKEVEMLIDIDCALPVTLIGDKVRLWQVLKNLLDNAAKFTLKGCITLTAKAINKNPIDNIFIKFQVKDTGIGIKESVQERLFVPFEQFHSNEVNVQGTGLGMVITKQLTELMGGKISIESTYGEGTTVTVIIPFKLAKPVLSINNNCIREELDQKRILIVDDNPLIVDILTCFLKNLGILPESAAASDEVYEKIAYFDKNGTPFDIILLDYMLENETCLDLARKIKNRYTDKTKLMLLSAYAKRLTPEEIKEYGFAEVIEKPFVPTSFVQKICLALNININPVVNERRIVFKNANVLLCEDNKINQEVAQGLLGMCNITPVIAENGQEALQLLKSKEFHLILMDILMPVMDGHQATIQIRNSNEPYANIPIVAMTANAMKDEVDKCKAEGMNAHVAKPIDFDKLYAQLIKWLPKHVRAETDISTEETPSQTANEIEGIDMVQGIARFGGNRERYMRALKKFAASSSGIEQPFEKAILEENIESIKRQVHTLKGVSGNLGITQIYNTALAFEDSLNAKNPDRQIYNDLQSICININKAILTLFPDDGSTGTKHSMLPAGTAVELKELLKNLTSSLQSFDPETCDKHIAEIKSKKWQSIDEQVLQKLCSDVESYNFESALELVYRIERDLQ